MKKINKKLLASIIVIIVAAILFAPLHIIDYDDGGTVRYSSLTYSVVKWKRYVSDWSSGEMTLNIYEDTCVYFFPNNFKSLDELWGIRN